MNFLAHTYLSGNNDHIKVGNFFGDWFKGHDYLTYHEDIQKGIVLHRFIDFYTDTHPIVRQSKTYFNSTYHKYSGIITDILYDHFLANNWKNYSNISLREFTYNLNSDLRKNAHHFPTAMQEFYPPFMKHRWMESYVSLEGIKLVFDGMSKHTSLPNKTEEAMVIIIDNYDALKSEFEEFFPSIISECEQKFEIKILF